MKVKFNNFRRFHYPGAIELRPITVLVGENSSGKTSFLAGLRYIFDMLARGRGIEASFNREPFFLGAYDQIAHFRGGGFGRATQFSLALEISGPEVLEIRSRTSRRHQQVPATPIEFNVMFSNEKSQPAICAVKIRFEDIEILLERPSLLTCH